MLGMNGKKTVAGITASLTKIKSDLEILEKEKTAELKDFEIKKKEIELQIEGAEQEKTKGYTIFKNISNLLGEPVIEEEKAS